MSTLNFQHPQKFYPLRNTLYTLFNHFHFCLLRICLRSCQKFHTIRSITGIIVGVIVRYAIPSKEITSFAVSIPRTYSPDGATTIHTKCQEIQRSLSTSTGLAEEDKISFAIGETVALREVPNVHEGEGGDTLFCAISGKSFAKEQEAVFQRSVSVCSSL